MSDEEKTEEQLVAEETKEGVSALIEGFDSDPKKEEPEKESEVEKAEAKEEVVEEVEVEEKPEVDPVIAQLQQQIEALSAKLNAGDVEEEEPERVEVDITPSLKITLEEVEEAQLDSDKMLILLNKVATSAVESALQGLPSVVSTTVARQTSISNTISNFWESHPQLEGSKEFVKFLIREVEGDHPEWGNDYQKILDEVATRAYKNVVIKGKAEEAEKNRREEGEPELGGSSNSSFAKKPGGGRPRGPSDTRSGEQREIDSLIAVGQGS